MARSDYETANSLLKSARDCGLDDTSFRQVPSWRALEVLDQIFDAFTTQGRSARMRHWLWNDLRQPCLSLSAPHGLIDLQRLGDPTTAVWLVTEDFGATKRGTPFWLFESTLFGAASVLQEHHLLEFYIVSRRLAWLVGENHHGIWFASGDEGVSWLEAVGDSTAEMLERDDGRAAQQDVAADGAGPGPGPGLNGSTA